MGLHLDNTLTIQTKRRFISAIPATIQELRNKYQVMSHMWLCKEALRLTREEGQAIEKALWATYRDPHHRIEHWLTLLTIANSGGSTTTTEASSSSSSSNPADQRFQRMEKKFAELERAVKRSRSSRMRPQGQLAVPAQPTCGEEREKEKTARAEAKATKVRRRFNQVSKLSTRLTRTRPSTGSSFTKPKTRKEYASCSKKANVSRALARETIVVFGVESPMFSTTLAIASKTWLRSEQRSFFISSFCGYIFDICRSF